MSDDDPNDSPHPYGSLVHYWQQVEDGVPTDQQLVSGRGARATVTQEELMQARERMRAVSHMGATRRLRESDRRRSGGGRRGGRQGGRGRGARGGPGGRRTIAGRRMAADELVRKPRQRWDEGDFLYESSSSDDEDFFGTGAPAQDDDSDIDNRHPDVDDDDGARGDDRGDGGDRPCLTREDVDRGSDETVGHYRDEVDADAQSGAGGSRPGDGDTMCGDGAGGEDRTVSDDVGDGADDNGPRPIQGGALKRLKRGPRERHTSASHIPIYEDSFSDDGDEERIEQDDGSDHARNDTQTMHATTPTGSSAAISESQQDGPSFSAVVTSDVRRPPAMAEQESMLPPRSGHGVQPDVRREVVAMPQSDTHGPHAYNTVSRPPPALVEGTDVACPNADLPEGEVSHTPAPKKSVGGHVGLACPTGSLPVFRVGRPHEVDLGMAEMATRHLSDGLRSIAQRSSSDSFDGAKDGGFVALAGVERAARPSRPPSDSEHQHISATAGAVGGVRATDTVDATQQPVVGSLATTRRDRATVLPTVAFYTSGTTIGGLDEQGKPSTLFMGTRSIETVDGARHTAMTKYEARHGNALPTKTSDVQATRAAKACLSRARKKASTRKALRSSPRMCSHLTRSGPVHLEDEEIAPDGDALDVGGRAATSTDPVNVTDRLFGVFFVNSRSR
ncbi:hypothetical protein CBR_g52556 [Chara braunii]|uniref:Uncharacterized protein n=1 Tax=Chara braunii TaxID=69332 RepID=A0A388MAM8_CHABU|nr:hypothetical protein CBR_g52556 [Chara braunii]|eukprot:GBG91522.1 hypothetical protein CBR_g52556 [Chara braunii]